MQDIKKYLQENQPIVYKILQNTFKNHKNSHAYLINGTSGAPILDVAYFLAQSLICENKNEDGLACETCLNCQKIINHTYADFIFYNGNDLKKDEVNFIQEEFNKSAIEKANLKIYIVHQIEKVSLIMLNKLLKFIEEPESNIIAIFTTNSLSSILPTIISRCQVINLKQLSNNLLIKKLMEEQVNQEDVELVCRFSNDFDNSLKLLKSENYPILKDSVTKSLNYLATYDNYYYVYFQMEVLDFLMKNELLEVYLDMMEVSIFEALKIKNNSLEPSFLKETLNKLKECDDLENKILQIVMAKKDLFSNANKQLVMDKLLINLIGW